jgi:hypothetical protein
MGKIWAAVVVWFEGKKTILGGGLVMAAAVAGVWAGKLDPATGLAVLGFGLSIAGMSAKANRHQAQLLAALRAVAQVAGDERSGRPAQAVADAESAATTIGLSLVPSAPQGGAAK